MIYRSPQQNFDTLIQYRYYNEKGQLMRIESLRKGIVTDNSYISYNDDGYPDRIKHDHISKEFYVFIRTQKKEKKEIRLEMRNGSYRWRYNSNDQCISFQWKPKKNSTLSKTEVRYHYIPDGTLSKVIEKRNGKEYCTTTYLYEK